MNHTESGQPYFSIVMPAYGVEKYIEKAISSIQRQTFSDWEIIVVDDCTKDRSGEIAEKFAGEDGRISVLHHEKNKGLSGARNTGLKEARGVYIWFMDPDDTVEETLLQDVYDSLVKNPAEAVVFGLVEEYYDKQGKINYTHVICPEEHYYRAPEEFRGHMIELEQETLYGYAWNKFYQLAYLRNLNLKYENVRLIEDITFNVKYFMDIQKLNVLAITPYHYGKRLEANLTNQFVPDYFKLHKARIEMLYEQFSYWGVCTQEVRSTLGSLYARYILSALERNCDKRSGMNHAQRYRWCRAVFAQGLFQKLIPAARAKDSVTLRIALALFRRRKAILCLMMGRGIYWVRRFLPMVYSKIKTGR